MWSFIALNLHQLTESHSHREYNNMVILYKEVTQGDREVTTDILLQTGCKQVLSFFPEGDLRCRTANIIRKVILNLKIIKKHN